MTDEADLEELDGPPPSMAMLLFTVSLRKIVRFMETVELQAEYGELNGKKFKKFVRQSDTPIRPAPGLDAGCVFDDDQRDYLLRFTASELIGAFQFYLLNLLIQIREKRPGELPVVEPENGNDFPKFSAHKSWDDVAVSVLGMKVPGFHYCGFDAFVSLFDKVGCPISEDSDVVSELTGLCMLRERFVQLPIGMPFGGPDDEDDPYEMDYDEVAHIQALLLETAMDLDGRAVVQFGFESLASPTVERSTE